MNMPIPESLAFRNLGSLFLRACTVILLLGIAAWTSEIKDSNSVDSSLARGSEPCADSLYLAMKQMQVQSLTTPELIHYIELDKACNPSQIQTTTQGPISHPNEPEKPLGRNPILDARKPSIPLEPRQPKWGGYSVMVWAGAFSAVVSAALYISVEDECDGLDDFLKSEYQCQEEAEDTRTKLATSALLSTFIMFIGIVGNSPR